MKAPLVLNLDQIGMKDISLVGGKCASLSEMIRNLSSLGVSVPQGFAITTEVYWKFSRRQQAFISCSICGQHFGNTGFIFENSESHSSDRKIKINRLI